MAVDFYSPNPDNVALGTLAALKPKATGIAPDISKKLTDLDKILASLAEEKDLKALIVLGGKDYFILKMIFSTKTGNFIMAAIFGTYMLTGIRIARFFQRCLFTTRVGDKGSHHNQFFQAEMLENRNIE